MNVFMVHDIDLIPYINLKNLDEISLKNVFFLHWFNNKCIKKKS